MKQKTHRLLSLLLCLVMVLGMLPAMSLTAFAAEPGISITAATENTIGTGWSYDEDSKTLTLNGYDGGYIKLETSVTVKLVGANTIRVNESGTDAYGIDSRGTHGLTIDGTGSLTINVSANTRRAYGINNQIGVLTMSGGTVNITASSTNGIVYGVYGNAGVALEGGKLTVGVSGQSDGYGIFANAGKLTVDSGAEVAVKVTNNGSSIMYGIYNNAYAGGVTDNGDIALAGTVTVTRDSGSTGTVYGIANGGTSNNIDGVISITGGTVTVTNAHYGIVAFTEGNAAAFEDVKISGGTVNITSTTSDSLGIVSWNNGVTISGGTVTASTANKALWLVDSDSDNKTGLVKITDDAKVSLTSTDYKALVVQGDESNTSTRVHQINLTSGGSVTVKSTSSDESYYAFPVQGYFNLGSSTKITEGSFRAADGINAGGGKPFQSDNSTKRLVVAYSTPAPDANSVSVNGHPFAAPTKLYYKNGDSDTGNGSTDYNAHYDPATGVLELKNYNSGPIMIGGSVESDITIKLVGNNVINSNSQSGIVNNNGGDITITAGSDATLTINVTNDSYYAFGIACDIPGSYASRSRAITISGKANVTVNATATSTNDSKNAVGISTKGTVAIKEDASFKAVCKSSTSSTGLQSAAGIYGNSGVTINTTGKVDIDVSQCSGAYNYGIYGNASNNLTKVGEMTIKWKQSSGNGAHVLTVGSFDSAAATHAINVDTTNCVATYRYGTPYSVTVNNGSCNAANGKYLEGDTVTVTANTISDPTFKKWTSADVTVASETSAETTFTMPAKAVTVTANYNLFTTEPSFARTSDTQGTISFTLAATPSSAPKLVEKDSDDVVGGQYFYGSDPERSNTVTDGTGPYNVPAGEYRIAVKYGSVWFYSDVFTVDYTGIASPAAAVGNVTVSGTTGTAIAATDVNITLTNDKFNAIDTDTNVTSWFTNLPNGLEAKVKTAVNANDTTATITISGTPTVASDAVMQIKLPAANLVSSAELNVTANANAKFNISAPATYTVSFAANGGTGSMADVTGISGEYTLPANGFTAPDGKQFKAWSVGGVEKAVGDKITVTANTTVTAVWENIPVVTYTVSFAANGGTGSMADVTGISGEYTLPANGFTAPDGKQFKAWSVGGVEKAVGDKITVTANTTVTAVWENIPVVTYTVSFAANGGTGSMADVTGVSGEYTLPANGFTAPDGKQFKAWSVGGVEKAAGDKITVTANTTVTAVWETIPAGHTHSYGSEWKSDADKHWHECSCGAKTEEAAHTASDWITDTAATATTDGTKHKECTVCHRVLETGTIPATGSSEHTHSYGSEWKTDADKHWHECYCGARDEEATHTAGDWITDTAATATTDGTKHKECTVCHRVLETGTIPATGGSVVIIPDTDETDKSEPENPGTGAAVNPGTGAAAAGSSFGYPFVALAAVHAIYTGTKKLAKKDEE